MAFLLILISSVLLFSKSKYFPKRWHYIATLTRKNPLWTRIVGYFLLGLAAILYIKTWGGFTGFIIWSIAVMLCLSSVVMFLPVLANLLSNKQINNSANQQ
ncbi:MAG: hypothetical protein AAGG68_23750 [Bacteroidota bacterium]